MTNKNRKNQLTENEVVSGCQVARRLPKPLATRNSLNLISLCAWLVGCQRNIVYIGNIEIHNTPISLYAISGKLLKVTGNSGNLPTRKISTI